jgi:sugar lactone lactonase YvrE
VRVRIIVAREEVGDVESEVAEGPIWDDRFDLLRWVDLNRGFVHGYNPVHGQARPIELGQHVGFIVPLGADQLLAGLRDGFAAVALDGTVTIKRTLELDRPHLRMNDGKSDSAGRVWVGTMGIDDPQPEGTLYRLDNDWAVHAKIEGLTIPNGIGWSPEGSTMYFTDTTWGRIDSFSYDSSTGEVDKRRTFVEIPGAAGQPDGLTVDEEGCVWVALWYGAAVHRYAPTGRLDTIVRIPALQATSCVFGGTDRRDLFITSASLRLTAQEKADYPRSGRVFTCRPGAIGVPTDPFIPAP